MRISFIFRAILSFVLFQFVIGCAMKSPVPGSEKVKIINVATIGCKKLGEINSSDYSKISLDEAEKTHESNLIILKNRAAALGANAIVLATHETNKDTETFRAGNARIDQDIYTHNMIGIVYYCR